MRKQELAIHSENILPIIKKWLYSDKEIFLRELVSNAIDALNKAKILRDQELLQAEEGDFQVTLQIDPKKKTLTIADTGIGMTEKEVETYIAQIAFSGAEDFVAKFRSETEKDPIIGHFGLGFYSAYMVAAKVEIETRSYLPEQEPVFWVCDGSSSYEIGKGSRTERGTQITLYLDEASLEYLEEPKIWELLRRYCAFLPFPISLSNKPLHNRAPLWLKSPAECTEKEYLEFHRQLYPTDPDPLFWIHLNVDYPFHLQGILYFPKVQRRLESKERAVQLYCNRVFVSDNCKDILPDFLMLLHGAIDSPDIPLNVSRSYLQLDQNVKQVSAHISKKVSDRLLQLYKTDRSRYLEVFADIEMILKLGILQEEKFYDKIQEALLWKNSEGSWTTLSEYLERAKEKKVYYAALDRAGPILTLFREKKIEVLFTSSPIDTALIHFLEEKLSTPFQRIDAGLGDVFLDPSREKSLLDAEGKSGSAKIAHFIQKALEGENLSVEAKSFASEKLPALLVLEEKERRLRDYFALTQGKAPSLPQKKTFVVNTNHKLVQTIARLQEQESALAKDLAKGIYELSLLSQRELEPTDLEQIVSHQTEILEKLASLLP